MYSCYGSLKKIRTRQTVYSYRNSCSLRCRGASSDIRAVTCDHGSWSSWSSCDVKTGLQTRTARLTSVTLCGIRCMTPKQSRPCLVNCEWGPWTKWNECKQSGSTWVRERTRVKDVTETNGGSCSGDSVETQPATDLGACTGKLWKFYVLGSRAKRPSYAER